MSGLPPLPGAKPRPPEPEQTHPPPPPGNSNGGVPAVGSNKTADAAQQHADSPARAPAELHPPGTGADGQGEGHADATRSAGGGAQNGGHAATPTGANAAKYPSLHRQSAAIDTEFREAEGWGLPAGLPLLHKAVWRAAAAAPHELEAPLRDLETMCDELNSWALDEKNLVWVNPDVYDTHGRKQHVTAPPRASAPAGSLAPTDEPPKAAEQMAPGADKAMKALLHRAYLWHACHPLTIAAAYGNIKVLRLLIRKVKGDAESNKVEMDAIARGWIKRPASLPTGCPWVTPLAAAALGDDPSCVEALALQIPKIHRRNDRSSFGCFSFGPIAVAQTEGAVANLFKFKCCNKDAVTDLALAARHPGDVVDARVDKAEAQLFRSRLSMDKHGRSLEDAVLELDPPARVSLDALTGLLKHDLDGDLLQKGLPQRLVERYDEAGTAKSMVNDTQRSQKLRLSDEQKTTLLRLLAALLTSVERGDDWVRKLVDDAWANGPQELAALLLQVSTDAPKRVVIAAPQDVVITEVPEEIGGNGFPSLLLAFGAKLQAALLEGKLPGWLLDASDDGYVQLVEDLIRRSVVNDPKCVVRDAEWLVMQLLEPCMAHKYKEMRTREPPKQGFRAKLGRLLTCCRPSAPVHPDPAGGTMPSTDGHAYGSSVMRKRSDEGLEDGGILHVARNLMRETANTLLKLHKAYQEDELGERLRMLHSGPAAKTEWQLTSAGGTEDARAGEVGKSVQWKRALLLAARLVRHTLDPPQEFGYQAVNLSYFIAAKAVTQLLYIHERSSADEEPDDGVEQADRSTLREEDIIDIALLGAIARRHPHEAARLLHSLDPEPVKELDEKVPMDLPYKFYAVFTRGDRLSGAAPSTDTRPTIVRRFFAAIGAIFGAVGAFFGAFFRQFFGLFFGAFFGAAVWDGLITHAPQQWDVTQACMWTSLWRPLTHFILLSTRAILTKADAPAAKQGAATATNGTEAQAFQFLRRRSYALVLLAQLCQVGSIPVVVVWLAVLLTVGLAGRILHYTFKILSFVIPMVDRNEANRAWLGITREDARRERSDGIEGATDGSTYVVVKRVPIKGVAAMPAALLYQLASSSQVNPAVFASPTVRAIIMWRWQHFARYYLLMQFLEHLIFMMFFVLYAFSLSYGQDAFADLLGNMRTATDAREDCAGVPLSPFQQVMLSCVGMLTLTCVVQEVHQLIFFGRNWFRQPWNLMDAASIGVVTTILALHFTCSASDELLRGLAAVEVALLFIRLLYFAMVHDHMGSFFRMVIVVLRDLSLFFIFLGVVFIGWGLALTVLQGEDASMLDIYIQLFMSIFGDGFGSSTFTEGQGTGSNGLDRLYRVFAALYQILVTIILLNLLIAIINDSYERVKDANEYESLRNRLTLIVEVESLLPGALLNFTLKCLARADLYIVQPQAATAGTQDEDEDGEEARRELQPPSEWSGRTAETKRFVEDALKRMAKQQQSDLDSRIDKLMEDLKTHFGKSISS